MSCNFFSSLYIISGGGVRRYSILQQLNSLTISWKILKNTILIHYYYPFYKKTLFWKSSYTTGSTHLFVIFFSQKMLCLLLSETFYVCKNLLLLWVNCHFSWLLCRTTSSSSFHDDEVNFFSFCSASAHTQ